MIPSKQDMQLQAAMWALKRIVRKKSGFEHRRTGIPVRVMPSHETCDCPQCIAKYALEQIQDYEDRWFVQELLR